MTPNLEREIAAYEKQRGDLEAHHMGKWVVFYGDDFGGAFDSLDSAAQEAVRRFGRGPFLIRQVGAPPMTLSSSVMYHPIPIAH